MAITIIQEVASSPASATPYNFNITGVTSGSTLVLIGSLTTSRVYAVTDDKLNNWCVQSSASGSTNTQFIAVCKNAAAGTTSVTINSAGSATVVDLAVFELSTCSLEFWGSFERTGNDTTSYCAASGTNVAADSLLLCSGRHSASGTTLAPGTGYTVVGTATTTSIFFKRAVASLLTAEIPYWTNSTTRPCGGMFVSLRDMSVGGGGSGGGPLVGGRLAI